jgi:hypothetical protein
LPYPDGAATHSSGAAGAADNRSSRAVLGTMPGLGGGGWSLDSRSSNGGDQPGPEPPDPVSCPLAPATRTG